MRYEKTTATEPVTHTYTREETVSAHHITLTDDEARWLYDLLYRHTFWDGKHPAHRFFAELAHELPPFSTPVSARDGSSLQYLKYLST